MTNKFTVGQQVAMAHAGKFTGAVGKITRIHNDVVFIDDMQFTPEGLIIDANPKPQWRIYAMDEPITVDWLNVVRVHELKNAINDVLSDTTDVKLLEHMLKSFNEYNEAQVDEHDESN